MRGDAGEGGGRADIERLGNADTTVRMNGAGDAAAGVRCIINGDDAAEGAGGSGHAGGKRNGGRGGLRAIFQEAGGERRGNIV